VHLPPRSTPDSLASRGDRAHLRLIVFLTGLTSIGTEISASRLIAPYFGESTFIWANVIGFTLTFLSLGYWLGGRLADRFPRAWVLYAVTSIAAIACMLLPAVSQPILRVSLDAFDDVDVGAFFGSLVAVLLILAVPITLMGFVSPYAIRLLVPDVSHAGNTSGNTYALGTVGSIAGSFLPALLLIPWVGTRRTFLILGTLLLVPSVIGLVRSRVRPGALAAVATGIAVITATVFGDGGPIRRAEEGTIVYETESSDNYVQVVQNGSATELFLNDGHAIHSLYDPAQPLTGGPWDYFMVAPLFYPQTGLAKVGNALLIGLAGGTVSTQLTAAYGPIPIDGVEIDPEIARVGRHWFGMTQSNLNVIVADGRYVLRSSTQRWDLIGVDAYRQPYIPFQLTTREFFTEVREHLTASGVVVINVGRTETDYRLVDAIASTMRDVFPSVYLIDAEAYANTLVVATPVPTNLTTFARSVAVQPPDSLVRAVGETSLASGNIRAARDTGTVFTDDHAPVEWLVDQIVIRAGREESRDNP